MTFVPTDTTTLAAVSVFVMEPRIDADTGEPSFPWDWSRWRREQRLIANGDLVELPGNLGSANLQLLRRTRMDEGDTTTTTKPDFVVEGAWLCVARRVDSSGLPDIDEIEWWGFIDKIDGEQVAGTIETFGSVTALEVGHLLDAIQTSGWYRGDKDSAYTDPIQSPPTANLGTADGEVIGNAKKLVTAPCLQYAFARIADDCGTAASKLWTRWRLLKHMLGVDQTSRPAMLPAAFPLIVPRCADGSPEDSDNEQDPVGSGKIATYLNKTDSPEVWDLRCLTWKGALDLVIPRSRGFGWVIYIGVTSWTLNIYTLSDVATYTVPAATAVNVDLSAFGVASVLPSKCASDLYDEVVVEGSPIVWIATFSFGDGNLESGWSADQQLNYEEAMPLDRSLPEHGDVFNLFRFKPDASNSDSRVGIPAAVNGVSNVPMCARVDWDGSALSLSGGVSVGPYMPTARFLATIPWPAGLKVDGTDTRTAKAIAFPVYLPPMAFAYDAAESDGTRWLPLNRLLETDQGFQKGIDQQPEVTPDARTFAMRVKYTPPHYFGLGLFDDSAETGGIPAALDYTKLVLTAAVEADQRVLITKTRPGVTIVRRRLRVTDDKLNLWLARVGAVLGVKDVAGVATPQLVAQTNFADAKKVGTDAVALRNDYPTAERWARELAAFAFRKRTAGTIILAAPDNAPGWASIGTMIGTLTEVPASTGVTAVTSAWNTVVEQVVKNFGPTPRLAVYTNLPAQPARGGFLAASPSGGGAQSLGLGGTPAMAISRLQTDVVAVQSRLQNMPVVPARTQPVATRLARIIGGNLLNGVQQIAYVADPLTITALYDPDVDTSYIDGIGNIWLFDEAGQPNRRALLRQNNPTYLDPLPINETIEVVGPFPETVASGPDAGAIMMMYRPKRT